MFEILTQRSEIAGEVHTSCLTIVSKKNFQWQNGIEVGIDAYYIPLCVPTIIRVDIVSKNAP